MGFFRKQEERLAVRLLRWKYEKSGTPMPADRDLETMAAKIVSDAHRIARERGSNVLSIIKDLVAEIQKKK